MKLYMKEKVFSWTDKFTVKDEQGQDRYYVEGEFFSFGKKLHIYNETNKEVAFIREKVMSFMPRFIVEAGGLEIFQIAQKFTFLKQRFQLEGLNWDVEGDFWAHDYTLYDGDRVVMRLTKHWFTWGDSYELDITNPEEELICLCVVLAIDATLDAAAAASASTTT